MVVLAFAGIFAGVAKAQKQAPPKGGPAKPFVFPKQETYVLKNGMKVTLVQYGTVPKVAIQAVSRVGSLNEKSEQRWISDITATLLKEGTAKRSAEQIARETAEMGGTIFTGAGTDTTTVGGEVLSEFDTKFISLLADIMREPRFDARDLETVRANKIREVAIANAQAGTIAWEKFRKVLFADHPYGDPYQTEAILKTFTPESVKAFYDSEYGAARTHLYVVGKFNTTDVKKAIELGFTSWKKGLEPIRNIPTPNANPSLSVIDRPGAPQSTIYLGMPAVSPSDADFIKFVVMDSLLGGSFGSRITSNIREDKGYTYSPRSSVWNRYKVGYWYENADVTTEATGASIKEILFEIDRLQKEPPTEAELQGIKNYLVGIYVLQNSSRAGVINQLQNVDLNELEKGYLDSYIQKIGTVSPKDVQEVARKYLSRDKMTIVVVGDRSKIDEQLKPYQK